MNTLFIIFSGIFGAIIGSFLNVLTLRYNTGKGIQGRSQCFSCGHTLSWYELIPILSWIIQKGRCRMCSSNISPLYIGGEALTSLFFVGIAARGVNVFDNFFDPSYLIATGFLFLIFSFLIVIFLYDIRHKIIPDDLSLLFSFFALLSIFFFDFQNGVFIYSGFHFGPLSHLLAGLLVPLPFFLLWVVSHGKWIGLGDPKLMIGVGLLFGISWGFSVVCIAFWIAALFTLGALGVNKIFKKKLLKTGKDSIMKEELPFAPFLIIAIWFSFIVPINLFFFT